MSVFDLFAKRRSDMTLGGAEYIIAGLGNPGGKYEMTRHNAGFMALDVLTKVLDANVKSLKFRALCGTALIGGKKVLLIKPQTFMNLSGEAVRDAAAFYKIPPERVIVIFDDISLPMGKIRVRQKGSDGGHNGIKNIIYHLNSDAFPRVKIGVGSKNNDGDLKDFVLGRFSQDEMRTVEEAASRAARAAIAIVEAGPGAAMQEFNGNGNGEHQNAREED